MEEMEEISKNFRSIEGEMLSERLICWPLSVKIQEVELVEI